MRIRALGGLELEGSTFTRPKPLLLLTYLALEGPKARRDVAELFWPRSGGRLRTLTVTLGRLRSGALGCVASDGRKVWAEVDTDVAQLRAALDRDDLGAALELYRGPFAEGFRVDDGAIELEEWVVGTRERIAARLQRHMVACAAADVVDGRVAEARRVAERAVRLPGAPPSAVSDLDDLHATLLAVGSVEAAAVAADCEGLDIGLAASRTEAIERLRAAASGGRSVGPAADDGRRRQKGQRIRFVTSVDGARIAFATLGDGPPLVKAANWMTNIDHDLSSPVWRHWLDALAREHTLVYYDERGSGLSDRDVPLSLDAFVTDLETIVDELGLERFDLFGMSQGAAASIAYAARHPERVRRLALMGAYIEPHSEDAARVMVDIIRTGWGRDNPAFRQVFTSLFMPEASPEQMVWFNDLQRVSATPEQAAALATAILRLDARSYLPHLRVPTLVFHARNDAVVPFDVARRLVAEVAHARLVPLESNNHVLLEHESAWQRFSDEMRRFLSPAGDGHVGDAHVGDAHVGGA